MRAFDSLSEQEILALAISLEEDDERTYADYAERLRPTFPASAAIFDAMGAEEATHRSRLLESYRTRFGNHIPLIRRQDVRGFVGRRPIWLVRPLGLKAVQKEAEIEEISFSKPTLDQVFLDVVGKSMRDEEAPQSDSAWENIKMERAR